MILRRLYLKDRHREEAHGFLYRQKLDSNIARTLAKTGLGTDETVSRLIA